VKKSREFFSNTREFEPPIFTNPAIDMASSGHLYGSAQQSEDATLVPLKELLCHSSHKPVVTFAQTYPRRSNRTHPDGYFILTDTDPTPQKPNQMDDIALCTELWKNSAPDTTDDVGNLALSRPTCSSRTCAGFYGASNVSSVEICVADSASISRSRTRKCEICQIWQIIYRGHFNCMYKI
jgi:hypothetical protein